MAVNIDDVYQKVLAIANKEQRGYITPQEFNLFANQAQKEIFEQYFYDLNQFKRVPGSRQYESDMTSIINDKLSSFTKHVPLTSVSEEFGIQQFNVPVDFYRFQNARTSFDLDGIHIEKLTKTNFFNARTSPLTKATRERPLMYISEQNNQIFIQSSTNSPIQRFTLQYFKKPEKPNWTYIISPGSHTALYDGSAGNAQNFELHPSEESELVYKILKLAGISMVRDDIMRAGQGMEAMQIQQEKQ
tara:strand:- start:1673 stop:2407 length:735 start_codon:yes stop_codon:yes gene_type:complete